MSREAGTGLTPVQSVCERHTVAELTVLLWRNKGRMCEAQARRLERSPRLNQFDNISTGLTG